MDQNYQITLCVRLTKLHQKEMHLLEDSVDDPKVLPILYSIYLEYYKVNCFSSYKVTIIFCFDLTWGYKHE